VRHRTSLLLAIALTACSSIREREPVIEALPRVRGDAGTASARIDGEVGRAERLRSPQVTFGQGRPLNLASPAYTSRGGAISLDLAETDIREVVAQILGGLLKVNYTIDQAVRGAATLHTALPLSRPTCCRYCRPCWRRTTRHWCGLTASTAW
jgi:general secretion pathway protein D